MIAQLTLAELDETRAVIECPPIALAMMQSQTKALTDLLQQALGRAVTLTLRAGSAPSPSLDLPAPSGPAPIDAQPDRPAPAAPSPPVKSGPGLRDHPLVRRAADLFSARIVDIRESDPSAEPFPPG